MDAGEISWWPVDGFAMKSLPSGAGGSPDPHLEGLGGSAGCGQSERRGEG